MVCFVELLQLDAFNGVPKKRSKTAIIVKNLPAKTPIESIRNKFAHYGELQRVIMPPDCPTCLLEFTEPSEARTAFRSLAYINFNGNPLYLEWAPEDAFSKPADKSQIFRADAPQVCVVFETCPLSKFLFFSIFSCHLGGML